MAMATPIWLRWMLIPALLVFAVPAIVRLVALRTATDRPADTPDWHEDLAQLFMAGAMVAMLLSLTHLVPRSVWVIAFGVQAILFGAQLFGIWSKGCGCATWPRVHHLMASLGMAYALAGMTGIPALADSFGIYFLGYTGWSVWHALRPRLVAEPAGAGPSPLLHQPRVTEFGRATMGLGMAYMMLASVTTMAM
jgi:hypothetical protein